MQQGWGGAGDAVGAAGHSRVLGGYLGCNGGPWGTMRCHGASPCPPPPEVTSETFDKERFLGARGLSRGGWAHLSMLVRAPDYGVGLGEDCHPLGTPHGERLQGGQADRGALGGNGG